VVTSTTDLARSMCWSLSMLWSLSYRSVRGSVHMAVREWRSA
jgi:hypothetical protein